MKECENSTEKKQTDVDLRPVSALQAAVIISKGRNKLSAGTCVSENHANGDVVWEAASHGRSGRGTISVCRSSNMQRRIRCTDRPSTISGRWRCAVGARPHFTAEGTKRSWWKGVKEVYGINFGSMNCGGTTAERQMLNGPTHAAIHYRKDRVTCREPCS